MPRPRPRGREKTLSRLSQAAILSAGECGAKDQVSQAGTRFLDRIRRELGEGDDHVDLVVKGRGLRVTEQIRKAAGQKLAKLGRIDPRVTRVEVEVIREPNPRIDGGHHVEVSCATARRVFRAKGAGQDVAAALDQVAGRLERQLVAYRGKIKHRRQTGPSGLESGSY